MSRQLKTDTNKTFVRNILNIESACAILDMQKTAQNSEVRKKWRNSI